MAGGKQTPRQRMMGILYLVLLGLIALDVPDSLLDAFKHISDSLNASKTNVQTGIDQTFKTFEATKLKEQHDRALPIYNNALKAKQMADDLNEYIEGLKKKFIAEAGDIDPATGDYSGRENLDVSVHLMINDGKYAYELHKKIDDTRNGLLGLLSDREKQGVNLSLDAPAPPHINGFPDKDWENANFGEGIPMAAAMTALIKIQSDTKNAENEVVKKILGEVDQAVVNLDQFSAVAVPSSSYVIQGQPYTAQVFLTASDSKSTPDISVDGSKLSVQDGKGIYTGNTSSEGIKTWTGTIKVKQNDGTFKTYSSGSKAIGCCITRKDERVIYWLTESSCRICTWYTFG
jgi:gliding motility-associated protein GldM